MSMAYGGITRARARARWQYIGQSTTRHYPFIRITAVKVAAAAGITPAASANAGPASVTQRKATAPASVRKHWQVGAEHADAIHSSTCKCCLSASHIYRRTFQECIMDTNGPTLAHQAQAKRLLRTIATSDPSWQVLSGWGEVRDEMEHAGLQDVACTIELRLWSSTGSREAA